jgi:type II secretory pathway pseudopilin PulG
MLIIAIAAAVVVPSIAGFALSRTTSNTVQQVVNFALYARTQAISDAKVYRLNFDTQTRQIWLTVNNDGQFQPVGNDFGSRFTLPQGMKMTVQIAPQPNTQLIMTPNITATDTQATPLFGQPVWPLMNTVMIIAHSDPGTYEEFLPSGRVDPTLVQLTDKQGKEIDIGAATATDSLHVLSPAEMK